MLGNRVTFEVFLGIWILKRKFALNYIFLEEITFIKQRFAGFENSSKKQTSLGAQVRGLCLLFLLLNPEGVQMEGGAGREGRCQHLCKVPHPVLVKG